jgi:hypothetical protein
MVLARLNHLLLRWLAMRSLFLLLLLLCRFSRFNGDELLAIRVSCLGLVSGLLFEELVLILAGPQFFLDQFDLGIPLLYEVLLPNFSSLFFLSASLLCLEVSPELLEFLLLFPSYLLDLFAGLLLLFQALPHLQQVAH